MICGGGTVRHGPQRSYHVATAGHVQRGSQVQPFVRQRGPAQGGLAGGQDSQPRPAQAGPAQLPYRQCPVVEIQFSGERIARELTAVAGEVQHVMRWQGCLDRRAGGQLVAQHRPALPAGQAAVAAASFPAYLREVRVPQLRRLLEPNGEQPHAARRTRACRRWS